MAARLFLVLLALGLLLLVPVLHRQRNHCRLQRTAISPAQPGGARMPLKVSSLPSPWAMAFLRGATSCPGGINVEMRMNTSHLHGTYSQRVASANLRWVVGRAR